MSKRKREEVRFRAPVDIRRQSQEFHFSKIGEKVLGIKIYQQEKRDTPPAEEVVLASSILNSFSTAAQAAPHLRVLTVFGMLSGIVLRSSA